MEADPLDLLLIISTPDSGRVLRPLAGACGRRGLRWSCFFTNDGVRVLEDPAIVHAIRCADNPIACEHSWARCEGETPCPIALGSQTNNSALVGRAAKVIGL
jgi:hypothetical protein